MAMHKGIRIHQYLDDWLVRARSHQTCLQHTQILVKMCQNLGWIVNVEKSELGPKQVFDFVGYQFDLRSGRVRPTLDRWQNLQEKLHSTSSPRLTTHETNTVASQKQLESTKITRKGHSITQVPESAPAMVAEGKQCAPRSSITPNKTCSADIYRRIKRRVGHSLKRTHCKRDLVFSRKQAIYKLSGTKSSHFGLKRVPRSCLKPGSTDSNRQYHSSVIHKQGRRHEVGSAVCPTLENLNLEYQQTGYSKGLTHPRPSECGMW